MTQQIRIECACAVKEYPASDIPRDFLTILQHIRQFWQNGARGWAPSEASESLSRIDFDNLVDLAKEFPTWFSGERTSPGQFVLAWVALGAVAEGCLQWFLSVYKQNYLQDPLFFNAREKENIISPEDIFFAKLIQYFEKHVWIGQTDDSEPDEQKAFTSLLNQIRVRRNAIHARKADLGNWDTWRESLHGLLIVLAELESRVPYPDDYATYPFDTDGSPARHYLVRDPQQISSESVE